MPATTMFLHSVILILHQRGWALFFHGGGVVAQILRTKVFRATLVRSFVAVDELDSNNQSVTDPETEAIRHSRKQDLMVRHDTIFLITFTYGNHDNHHSPEQEGTPEDAKSNQRRDHEQGVENECCCFCGTQNAQEPHRLSVVAGSLDWDSGRRNTASVSIGVVAHARHQRSDNNMI
ncbi:hypothetical protein F2Q69_00002748 [Brassica cretica]|uniref:Secreted protein n=1 Tax=Brassica cretica TaxID=69181 RepID=A0A8S9NSH0_BRACR|nr:hypothetical protein F2Q69_00002748 [Brassica cretica]